MTTRSQVFFVYLGDKLPDYALYSLELAVKNSGSEIKLLGNKSQKRQVKKKNLEFISIEEFYNNSHVSEVQNQLTSSTEFKNGFWLKTLERFFVIHQFMKYSGISEIFHAELDQLLFRTDLLIKDLRNTEKLGLFYPLHTELKAVASVFFCNLEQGLKSLTDYALTGPLIPSEMELLANWAKENKDLFSELPTLSSYLLNKKTNESQKENNGVLEDISGVVDAAQIGQWIAGIDSTLVPIKEIPKTHFVDKPEPGLLKVEELSSLQFYFDQKEKLFKIKFKDFDYINLYNIHIHSKIHKWIYKANPSLNNFVKLANSQESIKLRALRQRQISEFSRASFMRLVRNPLVVVSTLLRVFCGRFELRPTSKPFLSGDTFREFSDFKYGKKENNFTVDFLHENSVFFCESDSLENFEKDVVPSINQKIFLILGNSDRNFSKKDFSKELREKCIAIFAQNLTETDIDLFVLPIGLENKWRHNHGFVLAFRFLRLFKLNKKYRIMWTFDVATNPVERLTARNHLRRAKSADYLGSLTTSKHRKSLNRYAFVASPPGNGLDTHRTWEAMYLRCVPIIKRSFMAEEYERLGLPVWIVDSYAELENLDDKFLADKYREFESMFDADALWFQYWERRIVSVTKRHNFL